MSKKPTYEPEQCDCCGQTTTYLLTLDRGTTDIVRALAARIEKKGINIVHPTKEMEVPREQWTRQRAFTDGVLTSIQIGNITRARAHGFVAKVKGEHGNWALTRKGFHFLRGEQVPRYAVMSKVQKRQIGYFEPHIHVTSANDLMQGEYWESIGYTIQSGKVVADNPVQKTLV